MGAIARWSNEIPTRERKQLKLIFHFYRCWIIVAVSSPLLTLLLGSSWVCEDDFSSALLSDGNSVLHWKSASSIAIWVDTLALTIWVFSDTSWMHYSVWSDVDRVWWSEDYPANSAERWEAQPELIHGWTQNSLRVETGPGRTGQDQPAGLRGESVRNQLEFVALQWDHE